MRIVAPGVAGLLVAIVLVPPPAAAGQEPPPKPEHLALQAREVLRRRCTECHGDAPERKAGLNILAHPLLVSPERLLVIPGSPDYSRLLELVEDGSMPQGIRPKVPEAERQVLRDWIQAGAPPFTRIPSEGYVLARILDDVQRLELKDRPYVRYLSLTHLLGEEGPRTELDVYRAALTRFVQLLAQPGEPALAVIEPTETVFRLDLRALGWSESLLIGPKGPLPLQPARLNRFDLLLLEYPYGVLSNQQEVHGSLSLLFLEKAQQVYPLPYVRADWFVRMAPMVAARPIGDVPILEKARQQFDAPLGLLDVQAELDWTRPSAELKDALTLPEFKNLGLEPLTRGGTVSRRTWERAYDEVVRRLKIGTPVIPLDGLTWPDYPPDPPFTLEVTTVDPDTKKAKDQFTPGDRLLIGVKSSQAVWIELIWTTTKGKQTILPLGTVRVEANDQALYGPPKSETGKIGYVLENEIGKEQITVFAYPVKDFPAGEVFQATGAKEVANRVVHPFYEGRPEGKPPFDPSRVVKKSIEIEIK